MWKKKKDKEPALPPEQVVDKKDYIVKSRIGKEEKREAAKTLELGEDQLVIGLRRFHSGPCGIFMEGAVYLMPKYWVDRINGDQAKGKPVFKVVTNEEAQKRISAIQKEAERRRREHYEEVTGEKAPANV